MNNRGFTVVELITTFAVASVIALVLFNVVLSIKNMYSMSNIKTNLLINQANLNEQFNSLTLDNEIVSIDFCSDSIDNSTSCYNIKYSNDESYKLIIGKKVISFNNYVYRLENGSYVDEDNIKIEKWTLESEENNYNKDSILNIKIPILSDQYKGKNFGLNYVYLFDSKNLDFNIE